MIKSLIVRVFSQEKEHTIKVWTVEQRKLARNGIDVLIPAVELTFPEAKTAIDFRKGASNRAKSKEVGFDSVFFSHYVGLTTRIRIEVSNNSNSRFRQ